jgi:HEAT repeat protein
MNRISCVVVFVTLLIGWLSPNVAVGDEPEPRDIPKLIEQLSSSDDDLADTAWARLLFVRSEDGVIAILDSLAAVDEKVRLKLFKILGDIGEPAVEPVFNASVAAAGNKKPRSPWASHVLTCRLKTYPLPLLQKKIRDGTREQRRVASWALYQMTKYGGAEDLDFPQLVEQLLGASINDSELYVRQYCAEALGRIEHESAIPALVKLVSLDVMSDITIARHVCAGLSRYGARSSAAIPALKRGIENGKLPPEALNALMDIQGKEALSFVVEKISGQKFNHDDRFTIAIALCEHPHPAAIPFMEEELWNGQSSSRVQAAMFFSKLEHPASVKHLRKCLSVLPQGKSELTHPGYTEVSIPRDLRMIAVRSLCEKGDSESYEKILEMLKNDLSIRVRTAAAEALGKIQYEQAAPALKACFDVTDKGHRGHIDGRLHFRAIEALGNIATEEAYDFLYAGLAEGKAQKQCRHFWQWSKDRVVFEKFLARFEKQPLDSVIAMDILLMQFHFHKDHCMVTESEEQELKKNFLASVVDSERFGADAELSQVEKGMVKEFQFYKNGFTKVTFSSRGNLGLLPCAPTAETRIYQKQGDLTVLIGFQQY